MESLIHQTYNPEKYQIIVVDGMSTDKTPEIVENITKSHRKPLIKYYVNKKEWQAAGRNLAIVNEKKSDLFAYIDGHCVADPNWLANLYKKLSNCDDSIAGIGSIHKSPRNESFIGFAIEQVFHSLIGGFGSCYRLNSRLNSVNGGAYFLYKRECLEKVDLYDEDMKCGEDFLLNFKLKKLGYKLLVEPEAVVYYYKRSNFSSFSKQMYNYGFAKGILWNKQRNALGIGILLPSLFLIYLIFLGLTSLFVVITRQILILTLGIYFLTIIAFSCVIFLEKKMFSYIFILPILYIIEHFSFAIGYIMGMLNGGWEE